MKTIYKYPLTPAIKQHIPLPKDAEILTVQVQKGDICLWASVNTHNHIKERCIEIYGTGHEIPDDGMERKYISTFQLDGGSLIYHTFEYTGFVQLKF
jgi:hypothetical protein